MDAKIGDWDDLRFFLAVARGGGLSAAARVVGCEASTVQRRMQRFERSLGVRLFDRRARGYALTQAGEELLAAAERLELELLSISRAMAGRDDQPSGSVRFTTVDVFMSFLLRPHLASFHARYPNIDLEVLLGPELRSLTRREADVALRPGAAPAEPGVIARRVCTAAVAVYASRAYLAAHGQPSALADLAGHRLVTGNASLAHVAFAQVLRRHAPEARVVLQSDSVLVQLDAARMGLGIVSLPCYLADVEPSLVRLFPPEPELGLPLWLIIHSDLRRSARVRALVDHLYDALQTEVPLLEGTRPQRA
jgi:DNA-binding transcriptional LysR family regulator